MSVRAVNKRVHSSVEESQWTLLMEAFMRKQALALLLGAFCAAPVFAQTDSNGVTTSTDPAKAAAVERHAQELRAQQANSAMAHEPTGAGPTHAAKHRHHRHHRHHTAAKAPADSSAKH
jgi:hypothetical protein